MSGERGRAAKSGGFKFEPTLRADFIGKGVLGGMNFDITTPGQIAAHMARPYGPGLNILTYIRPAIFNLFP
jgi:hypothetical protein